jgi:ketosteroid isomerase-like protein
MTTTSGATFDSRLVIRRVEQAISSRDLERLMACFAEEVHSQQPAHPDRSFRGRDQARRNWSHIFDTVPDLTARLRDCVVDGTHVWAEWEWDGHRRDGAPFAMRGVMVFDIEGHHIASVRLYMEPVQQDGVGIDEAIRVATGSS